MRRGLLIAPTAADIRDTMVEGPSGLLATARPDRMPKWEPSKRRVVWPNGAVAICISGEEPERARGHNVDTIWADELAAWQHAERTWKLAMLCLRKGSNPQALFTTTPKRIPLKERRKDGISDLLTWIYRSAGTKITTESTFANRIHLAEGFVDEFLALYEGTRLGKQEIYAELLDLVDAVWFSSFDAKVHVNAHYGEYIEGLPVHLAIDCGTSRFTGAVWFQVNQIDRNRRRVNVFGDMLTSGSFSRANAEAILQYGRTLPCGERLDKVRVDPASNARTSIGVAAFTEYAAVFGTRLLDKWPGHGVVDGLDFVELLLDRGLLAIHPRCNDLVSAFTNYKREERAGVVIDYPEEDQHPHGDMMDALRGGIRDAFPEGRKPELDVTWKHVGQVF